MRSTLTTALVYALGSNQDRAGIRVAEQQQQQQEQQEQQQLDGGLQLLDQIDLRQLAALASSSSSLGNSTDNGNESKYDDVRLAAFWIAGAFAIVATILSLHSVYKHMTNYRRPDLQRRIVRILLMVPIYAIDSWFSLRFSSASIYLNTLRDVYEAYVLYQFFLLLASFLHGEQELVRILGSKPPLNHPWPMKYCLPPMLVSHPQFFTRLKQALLQFVIIKPLLALISIALEPFGLLDEGHWVMNRGYPYICFFDNLSITIAFYALVVFYSALGEELKPFKPFFKFLCVKLVIFFSFWQSVAISGLVAISVIHDFGQYTAENVATGAQDFLICIEMLGAAILHAYAFPYKEYESMMNTSRLPFKYTFFDIFTISDVVDDTSDAFNIRRGRNYGKLSANGEPLPFDDVEDNSDTESDFAHAKNAAPLDANDAL
ncbi:hypothetical protein CAOG_02045 [Capsaspora owczarzaki ATCC 30864]|uniref:Transmembrane protein 184C n=1 Tax=Capsaspora owczarzaki (strain ATCC 30864) TaxID=595528 RepID=A0A0D2WKI8_CAPO3|nr:hypothetical protein CAOG_02045 [Capsaspora owczarzaki ATCC 30864]KJE90800.1 hypothetical protein CAOG_002045 [Capsaspora owczarzaki ATCC 30864]|eukprot:XP_004348795.1 hypothetical protein CAOG_02045 [Capsaspora owczarzaki ATCC 30864]